MQLERATIIVLDSVGIGELPDANEFGDEGSNTLVNMALATGGLNLPNLEKLGLGNIVDISGIKKMEFAEGCYGKALELSKGKDTTTGHWEIAGIIQEKAFPTYPDGFPKKTIDELEKATGRKVICNKPYSGTKVIEDYAKEQEETGALIVYTSADSVFQIAADENIIPINELYEACKKSLEICSIYSPVTRVIARPFIKKNNSEYERTNRRHDYSIVPPEKSVLDRVKEAGLDVIGIGKISDIFSGIGLTQSRGTNKDNLDGILKTIEELKRDTKGLIFTNLVDFDMKYGHRRDVKGYKTALEEFDNYIPEIINNLKEKEILIITADHGCDPTFKGTDHTREYVPILIYGPSLKKDVDLGVQTGFSAIAATVEELLLGKTNLKNSFAKKICK